MVTASISYLPDTFFHACKVGNERMVRHILKNVGYRDHLINRTNALTAAAAAKKRKLFYSLLPRQQAAFEQFVRHAAMVASVASFQYLLNDKEQAKRMRQLDLVNMALFAVVQEMPSTRDHQRITSLLLKERSADPNLAIYSAALNNNTRILLCLLLDRRATPYRFGDYSSHLLLKPNLAHNVLLLLQSGFVFDEKGPYMTSKNTKLLAKCKKICIKINALPSIGHLIKTGPAVESSGFFNLLHLHHIFIALYHNKELHHLFMKAIWSKFQKNEKRFIAPIIRQAYRLATERNENKK